MFNFTRFSRHLALRAAACISFSILSSQVLAATATLSLSGAPATTVTASQTYTFQPAAKSKTGRGMMFSISGKPSWAAFNISTGKLSGTPASGNVGTSGTIVISVSDGMTGTQLPGFKIAVKAAATAAPKPTSTPTPTPTPVNSAPTLSGSPAAQVLAGSAYSFQPIAADANGDALSFSVTNLPAWASFSTATGRLTGTPGAAQVGTYSAIQVSVTDGKGGSTRLSSFAITVTQISNGNATLSWTPPTQNADGSALTNLSGYKISYGTTRGAYTQTVSIANPSVSTYLIDNLTAGTYYFVITARNASGMESPFSNEASKTIN